MNAKTYPTASPTAMSKVTAMPCKEPRSLGVLRLPLGVELLICVDHFIKDDVRGGRMVGVVGAKRRST